MSEKFVASNGVEVRRIGGYGGIWWDKVSPEKEEVALREFFLHERDTELGRWRDPDSPYLVVYPTGEPDIVKVLHEQAGMSWEIKPESKAYSTSTLHDVVVAGRHYFAAHPEPKPWMDVPDGIYAVTPEVHPYERLIQKRNGAWLHLRRSSTEAASDMHSAEWVAKVASNEGRLTRLVPEVVSDDS